MIDALFQQLLLLLLVLFELLQHEVLHKETNALFKLIQLGVLGDALEGLVQLGFIAGED